MEPRNLAELSAELPAFEMRAEARPGTYNADKRTVDVVFTTGARVLRSPWFGEPFYEELSLDPKHVRMDRLKSGKAPVLNSHIGYRLDGVLGVVDTASVDGKEGVATLRFSQRSELAPVLQDLADGILCNISVGYRIYRFEKQSGGEEEIPVYRATDWEPVEISVVPIPADAGASVRSHREGEKNPCTIVGARPLTKRKNENMEPEVKPAGQPAAAPVVDQEAVRAEASAAATQAERARIAEISKMVRAAKLGDDFAARLVNDGTPLDQARAAVLDELARKGDEAPTRTQVRVGEEPDDTRAAAIEGALRFRADPGKHKLEGRAIEYRGMTLMDIARECVERSGQTTRGMSKMTLAERALHSTSDFPAILANVANKTLRDAYGENPQTFGPIVRRTTAPDFKPISRTQLAEAPQLEKVNEHGEFRRGKIGDAKETYVLATYGKIIGVTRQTIINDDLDALSRIPMQFGRQTSNLESDLVWGVFLNNPALSDNVALFHTTHKNLQTGTSSALKSDDLTSLNTVRRTIRDQKGLDGTTRLNLRLTHIAVPTTLETVADQITSNIQPTKADDVNVYAGRLQVIVEPRLNDLATYGNTAWYGIAGNGQVDMIELASLEGEAGPQIETRNGFDIDGMEIRVRMDVAAAPIDYRGMSRSNGA